MPDIVDQLHAYATRLAASVPAITVEEAKAQQYPTREFVRTSLRRYRIGLAAGAAALAVAVVVVVVASSGGSTTKVQTIAPARLLPPGEGGLTGRVGPGRPPASHVPTLTLIFTSGKATARAIVTGGIYQLDLPPGVWSVRSTDGTVCAFGLRVSAGSWQHDDFIYPLAGCQDLGGRPGGPGSTVGNATSAFFNQLRSNGLVPILSGEVHEPFLHEVQGRSFHVEGGGVLRPTDLVVSEYASTASAAADTKRFQPDGGVVDVLPGGVTHHVAPDWVGTPHVYQSGALLVIYSGSDAILLSKLASILGPSLIG